MKDGEKLPSIVHVCADEHGAAYRRLKYINPKDGKGITSIVAGGIGTHILSLDEWTAVPFHRYKIPVTYILERGTGDVWYKNGKLWKCEFRVPGHCFTIPAEAPHAMQTLGGLTFRMLVEGRLDEPEREEPAERLGLNVHLDPKNRLPE
jgi:mannose-6-phosphate isomerase-like protein (cupin superfamily)